MNSFLRVLAVFAALQAMAVTNAVGQTTQCIFDGVVHEEGDRVGPYTCTNGNWILSD